MKERRLPHLEKVEAELDHVKTELQEAASRVAEIRMQQDHLCNDIQMIAKQADQTQELIDNEIFHQLRLVEDHFIRLRYRLSESSGLVDASWAALSYVLRIFFWFSWIGVTCVNQPHRPRVMLTIPGPQTAPCHQSSYHASDYCCCQNLTTGYLGDARPGRCLPL